jgi:tetratricopeptide (TPR) repeat protein
VLVADEVRQLATMADDGNATLRRVARLGPVLTLVALGVTCTVEEKPAEDLLDGVEAISFLGDTLRQPTFDSIARERLEANLEAAKTALDAAPLNADSMIWYGRRLAYVGRYRDAIEVFTAGAAAHPEDARFFRHRGHRYITTRRLGLAIEDFVQAARLVTGKPDVVEPDGAPNARGIPISTLQSNIWYHLGLAHYLRGDFERALSAYRECMSVSDNPDRLVSTSHWLYMTLRRLERDEDAAEVLEPIHAGMDIIENQAYHQLLLMYKGELDPEALLETLDGSDTPSNAAVAYGVGNWYLYNGDEEQALAIFNRMLQGSGWAGFGYIAAEAEVARLKGQ